MHPNTGPKNHPAIITGTQAKEMSSVNPGKGIAIKFMIILNAIRIANSISNRVDRMTLIGYKGKKNLRIR